MYLGQWKTHGVCVTTARVQRRGAPRGGGGAERRARRARAALRRPPAGRAPRRRAPAARAPLSGQVLPVAAGAPSSKWHLGICRWRRLYDSMVYRVFGKGPPRPSYFSRSQYHPGLLSHKSAPAAATKKWLDLIRSGHFTASLCGILSGIGETAEGSSRYAPVPLIQSCGTRSGTGIGMEQHETCCFKNTPLKGTGEGIREETWGEAQRRRRRPRPFLPLLVLVWPASGPRPLSFSPEPRDPCGGPLNH
eukprot:gene8567-biopygen3140